MTERDLYEQSIPIIAIMAVKARKMSIQAREEWKREALETVPAESEVFIRKVFTVIETVLKEGGAEC